MKSKNEIYILEKNLLDWRIVCYNNNPNNNSSKDYRFSLMKKHAYWENIQGMVEKYFENYHIYQKMEIMQLPALSVIPFYWPFFQLSVTSNTIYKSQLLYNLNLSH